MPLLFTSEGHSLWWTLLWDLKKISVPFFSQSVCCVLPKLPTSDLASCPWPEERPSLVTKYTHGLPWGISLPHVVGKNGQGLKACHLRIFVFRAISQKHHRGQQLPPSLSVQLLSKTVHCILSSVFSFLYVLERIPKVCVAFWGLNSNLRLPFSS